jgi:glycosyltransferase involved in cell wall biosynthesis
MGMSTLAVVILTFNEEKHIERCVRAAQQFADQVFVVDSFSGDATVKIAESLGVQVVRHEFTNHAAQLAWGLDALPITSDWVMRLDADEVVSAALAGNIRAATAGAAVETNGFLIYRRVRFGGKSIRFGGVAHWVLRIWRRDAARIERRWMDEHMVLNSGRAQCLSGEFCDDNLNDIAWWTAKHNGYSTREAIELLNRKYAFLPVDDGAALAPHARRTRWMKERVYTKLPVGLRAFLYFAYRMSFRLGVLDGRGGFAFHFLQGCWYRFLVDAKVRAAERRMRTDNVDCVEAIRREFDVDPRF